MLEWWASAAGAELSQGDVIPRVYFASPSPNDLFLKKSATARGNIPAWVDSAEPWRDGKGQFYVRNSAQPFAAIVVSHSCELDKEKPRLLVAPVSLLDPLGPELQRNIAERRIPSKMPLLALPTVGGAYADLRCICSMRRDNADRTKRVASMSELGIQELQDQLIVAFSRLDAKELRSDLNPSS